MAEARKIDHVVVAVRDLDAAARTYEGLGFTLTPRAEHPPAMGTANRLAQFAGRNFIELLEVDRPDGQSAHDPDKRPPRFSFGWHNRLFLEKREGLSMLVLASDDARADLDAFAAAGLRTYAPFDFERHARLPDGQEVTVSFSLGFASDPAMPELAFFVCQNRFPQHFWKPDFQRHANGALAIVKVFLVAEAPESTAEVLARLTGGAVSAIDGGFAVACGEGGRLDVLLPEALRALAPDGVPEGSVGPAFAGLELATDRAKTEPTPASAACGLFLRWR